MGINKVKDWLQSDEPIFRKEKKKVKIVKVKKAEKPDLKDVFMENADMMQEELRYADEKQLNKEYREYLIKSQTAEHQNVTNMYISDNEKKAKIISTCIQVGVPIIGGLALMGLNEALVQHRYDQSRDYADEAAMKTFGGRDSAGDRYFNRSEKLIGGLISWLKK